MGNSDKAIAQCLMSQTECEHQRLICEKDRLETAQAEEKRLAKIESALGRIEDKLDEVLGLKERLETLEDWKTRLNGRAEALAEFDKSHTTEIKIAEPVHRAGEDGNHTTEREKGEVVIQMTAKSLKLLLAAIAASLFVLIGLALVAGERGWVVINKAKTVVEKHEATDTHLGDTLKDVKQSVDYLRHMHEFHGGPDPDVAP